MAGRSSRESGHRSRPGPVRALPKPRGRGYGLAVDMDTDTVVYLVANRRPLLIWSAICGVFPVGFVVSIPLSSSAGGLLLLPGLLGLFLGPLLFGFATGKTVISPEGLRTGNFFRRRFWRWDEVATVYSEKRATRAGKIVVIMVNLFDGRSFELRAPTNRMGTDPRRFEAVDRIQAHLGHGVR
jgi:hypothetical protein